MAHRDPLSVGQWVRAEFMAAYHSDVPWAHATLADGNGGRIHEGQLGRVSAAEDSYGGVTVQFLITDRLVTATNVIATLLVPATPTAEEIDAWLIHLLTA